MLFNSAAFAAFLPIVYLLYWLLDGRRSAQNLLLLGASYVFYGWWDYRFLSLLALSSIVDYSIGLGLTSVRAEARRRLLLALSLVVNLGLLGFFKYYGFFVESLVDALGTVGVHVSARTFQVVLPVGISFYTFQTLSYTIDVYRGRMEPTRDPVAFFAFVSFFPQLVAGPIERARNLLPQFARPRTFDYALASDGMRQILWGLFKKVAVADNLAAHVDYVFTSYASLDGVHLAIGVFLFAIQIYCDFSGYSDIAIGCSRLFGFDLMRNFAFPYFSRDIAEFWRRWHISLSSWFRDYLYLPLGGGRCGTGRRIRNVLIVFAVSGFWHGANWTFVVWGLLNGLYYVPLVLAGRHRDNSGPIVAGRIAPSWSDGFAIARTFALTLVAWVFFRADSLSHAFSFLGRAVTHPLSVGGWGRYGLPCTLAAAALVVEWVQRNEQHALAVGRLRPVVRWSIYYGVLGAVLLVGNFQYVPFIYFQF